jgi:hypothetical protein
VQVTGPIGSVSPPRTEGMLAMDTTRGRIVQFGGRTPNNATLDEVWEYGAQFRTFGSGCMGSAGIPRLRGTTRPSFGSVGATVVTNLRPTASIAVFVTGLSNMQSPLGNLPQLLTNFGLPGCRIYVSPDLFEVEAASGGSASWDWAVPLNLALFGASFYQQAVSLDPGINAAGLAVSNATAATIGW